MASEKPTRRSAIQNAGVGDIAPELQEQLAKRERRKAEARKKARPKMTYDLPQSMIDAINAVADDESVPRSDIVGLALARFIADYEAGAVTLASLKIPTRSLRVESKLDLGERWV